MAVTDLSQRPSRPDTPARELNKRRRRWHSFQVVFVFLYSGLVLDLITTAMGFQAAGKAYEQNPIGGYLIDSTGWVGLWLLLTLLAGVCYMSFRVICAQMSSRITIWFTGVVAAAALMRWVAVITAVLFLLQLKH